MGLVMPCCIKPEEPEGSRRTWLEGDGFGNAVLHKPEEPEGSRVNGGYGLKEMGLVMPCCIKPKEPEGQWSIWLEGDGVLVMPNSAKPLCLVMAPKLSHFSRQTGTRGLPSHLDFDNSPLRRRRSLNTSTTPMKTFANTAAVSANYIFEDSPRIQLPQEAFGSTHFRVRQRLLHLLPQGLLQAARQPRQAEAFLQQQPQGQTLSAAVDICLQ
ncbi:hypothetical protein ACFX13_023627 [Malus domestica]